MPGQRKIGDRSPDCQKISVLLPDDLADRLRRRAVRMGVKVGPLLRLWIEIQLDVADAAETVTKILPPGC